MDNLDKITDDILLSIEFKNLSNEELVKLAITKYCDYTWHPIVEVMMDRLSPGWEGKDESEEQ